MKRLGLDRVWWLVTPGNPLKDTRGLAPLEERVAAARALAHHPRIDVTGLEADIGTRYTYDTITYLVAALPAGAFRLDHGRRQSAQLPSLAALARYRRLVPIAVVDRLGPSLYATAGVAAQALRAIRLPESAAQDAGGTKAAGLDLPPWPQIAAFLDRAAGGTGPARQLCRR